METKTLKIEIPDGYQIDKEKSTFENIVFKKVDEVVIKWNKCRNSVEIKADGEHFILDGNPVFYMTWNDAIRFYGNLQFWKLPTIKQLQVVYKYFDEINKVIEDNGGFLLPKGFYWSNIKLDEFRAWGFHFNDGRVYRDDKNYHYYVRAVSTL